MLRVVLLGSPHVHGALNNSEDRVVGGRVATYICYK